MIYSIQHMCISQLSEYHNRVSLHFKGYYPSKPYEETLNLFSASLKNRTSHIAIVEDSEKIMGFCKVDLMNHSGKLDYLVVLEKYRGKGYGTKLMNWAMDTFRKYNIHRIEVKVVDGNDAIH